MGASVIEATDANYQDEVMKSDKPVLLDFWATWCGPCRMTKPIVEKIADEMKDELKVVAIDVDKNPRSAAQFNVMSIPTMFVIKGGQVKSQVVGGLSEEQLKQKISDSIKN
ncbi:MAG: thioredoxin [Patescibacteria group bacterium]